jgi:uncharacterized LabA/DUF88 family protein
LSIRPFANLSLTKNTKNIALAVDAMELACQTPLPTVVVIGSGEADFMPLVVRLRERGIRMICFSERTELAQEAAHTCNKVSRRFNLSVCGGTQTCRLKELSSPICSKCEHDVHE